MTLDVDRRRQRRGRSDQCLGTDGLTELLRQTRHMDLAEQLSHVADLSAHLCRKNRRDDITLVGLEVLPGVEPGGYYVI